MSKTWNGFKSMDNKASDICLSKTKAHKNLSSFFPDFRKKNDKKLFII